ncbi:MAG: thiamine-phosphate kinase [Alphaproteobacteria bacterium]|nr:thiamine-phosphate kinase [Alphaproteobacteria bacterium]
MSNPEQELIQTYFAPLAGDGAAGLMDDAATWVPAEGMETVLSTDTLVAGVHFIGDEPADLIARKALRVNFSDLVAKGAAPCGYLLNLGLSTEQDHEWLKSFSYGLAEDQAEFGCKLLGGDTVSTPGPLVLSVTAIGEVPAGKVVRRGTAKVGDVLYVTGTIGDSAIGLEVLKERCKTVDDSYLIDRYRLPRPRIECLGLIREFASAAMDVSDGLIGDLEQLVAASGVGAKVNCDLVPFSEAVKSLSVLDDQVIIRALTGGDDYEILFSVPYKRADAFEAACSNEVHHIGEIVDGNQVAVCNTAGEQIEFPSKSWSHFS